MGKRGRKRASKNTRTNRSGVNWYLMRPCVGLEGVCPPLCTWQQLNDGTYSLADVERFNQTITELADEHIKALERARNNRRD